MINKDTLCISGDSGCDYESAISFPIFQTSTFANNEKYSYSRLSNPTRSVLERECALLEGAKFGFAFSSGLAAINSVFALLKNGDRVILSDDLYGGTYRLSTTIYSKFGVEFCFVDMSNLYALEEALKKKTAMVFAETPTNPLMKIADIKEIARLSHNYGAMFAVDNTFLSPIFQNPILLGADLVVHSATKFLSGHHDVVAGVAITSDEEIAKQLALISMTLGNALSPFESWLVLRGLRTLPMRMTKHQENAFDVSRFLKSHECVDSVIYPGLPEHSGHEICKKQATGFGGVVSFRLKDAKKAEKLKKGGKIIKFAESLGGFCSLITYPLTQTHASIPKELRDKIGITEDLFRLSVGLENSDDIKSDLNDMLG